MQTRKSFIHKAGLAVGLATFLITSAQANPFQAELLKTGYGNDSSQPVQASDTDKVANDIPDTNKDSSNSDALPNPNDNRDQPCNKATDGKCGKDS